jgi:hypothetical protein
MARVRVQNDNNLRRIRGKLLLQVAGRVEGVSAIGIYEEPLFFGIFRKYRLLFCFKIHRQPARPTFLNSPRSQLHFDTTFVGVHKFFWWAAEGTR